MDEEAPDFEKPDGSYFRCYKHPWSKGNHNASHHDVWNSGAAKGDDGLAQKSA